MIKKYLSAGRQAFPAIFISVTFVLLLFFLNNRNSLNFVENNPTVQITATPTIAETKWQTYRNEKYRFELQYPTELNIDLEFENTYPGQTIIKLIPDIYDPDTGESNSIGIIIYKNQEKYSSLDWMKNNFGHSNYTNQNYENVVIDGNSGYKYTAEAMGKITTIVFSHNNNIFVFYTYGYEKYLDQILSTFKFLEGSEKLLGIQTNICCSCPTVIYASQIGENGWVEYQQGKNYGDQLPQICSSPNIGMCAPCSPVSGAI